MHRAHRDRLSQWMQALSASVSGASDTRRGAESDPSRGRIGTAARGLHQVPVHGFSRWSLAWRPRCGYPFRTSKGPRGGAVRFGAIVVCRHGYGLLIASTNVERRVFLG